MNKKWLIIMVLVGLISFVVGLLVPDRCEICEQRTPEDAVDLAGEEVVVPEIVYQIPEGYIASETVQIRVCDGAVQWYDGAVWETVGSLEDLSNQDMYHISKESLQALIEEISKKRLENQKEALIDPMRQEVQVAEVPKATPKPVVSTPAPVVTPVPVTPAPITGDDSADSGDDDPGDDSDDEGNYEPEPEPEPTPEPEPEPTPEPEPEPETTPETDTGDGEDIGWSDDYL